MGVRYYFKAKELLKGIEPIEMGLEYTSVKRIELSGKLTFNSKEQEMCLVCIEGVIEFSCCGNSGKAVFKDMLYIPPNQYVVISPENTSVIMLYSAPCIIRWRYYNESISKKTL